MLKVSIQKQELAAKIALVSRAISTRHAIQALSGILITAGEGGVTLRATDNDMDIVARLEASVEGEGTMLLPGRLLSDVVRSLGSGTVELEPRSESHDVELRCGASRFHLRSFSAEDFPPSPSKGEAPLTLPSREFVETVETVSRAASRDDMRPVLTGVLVTLQDGELTMVATDSYRLSVKQAKVEGAGENDLEANIPARALTELARIVGSEEAGEVQLSLTESHALFKVGNVELSTVLIDGQFPNYRQLLPESYEHDVRLDRAEFLEVTKRVGQVAQRNVPLRLHFKPGELTVSASTPDLGDAEESIPVPFEGEELEIGFNPEFLIEGIESVRTEEMLLRLISPLRPGLVQAVDSDEFRYLVMPIRLNG